VTMVPCKALIMVVSRTEAIETAVEALQPEVVGVISSQDIMGAVAKKCEELGSQAMFRYRLVDSPIEIHDSFERFEHLFSELEDLGYTADDVVLDASGGTTPMRLGAVLAANARGIRIVYQRVVQHYRAGDWVVDKERPREVVPVDNPLESTGLLREGQAIELFNRRDYGAAALVFEDVAKKVTGVERGHYYRGLLLLAEGYGAWDVADYGTALEKLKLARQELGVAFTETALVERASVLAEHINANLSFLGRVRGQLSVENVVDMVENARRRIIDQGRYDDGVARLYRAVEMWHQLRLLEHHSVSTKAVRWKEIPEDTRATFLEISRLAQLPEDLDLTRARALDRILSGEATEDDNVFRDLLQKRNNSILAHGLKPVGEGSARKFLEYVDAVVDRPEIRASAGHPRLREL
jgi:CRISPR-associated protein (TIGR02710 family)